MTELNPLLKQMDFSPRDFALAILFMFFLAGSIETSA